MTSERGLSWIGAIGILLAGFVALVGWTLIVAGGHTAGAKARAEDLHRLRLVGGQMLLSKEIHKAPDGRLDVSRMILDQREPEGRVVEILGSRRAGSDRPNRKSGPATTAVFHGSARVPRTSRRTGNRGAARRNPTTTRRPAPRYGNANLTTATTWSRSRTET